MTTLLTTLLSLILLTAGPSYAEWALVEYTRASFHPPAVTPLGAYQKASACLAALRAQHRINAEGAQYGHMSRIKPVKDYMIISEFPVSHITKNFEDGGWESEMLMCERE